MQGHEDLFDDDDSPSSAEDHDDVKQSTLDYSPEEHDDGPPTAKLSPGAQPNKSLQSLDQELGDGFGESDDEREAHGDSMATPTVAQFPRQETDDQLKTPSLAPVSQATTSDVSPIALHHPQPTPGTPNGGLADSVHAPSNQSREQAVSTPTPDDNYEDDEEAFVMPRDVTNVPWHARNDSVPASMRSFSTLDSVASSPVHSALLADRHEPVIRDSWPSMPYGAGRARGISQLTESSAGGTGAHEEFDPFRYDVSSSGKPAPPPAPTSWAAGVNGGGGGGIPTPPASNRYDSLTPPPQERERSSSTTSSNRNSLSAGNGPASSPMFAKLRSMFEGQQQSGTPPASSEVGGGSGTSSPARSRSTSSSMFQPTPRDRSSSLRKSLNAADLFNMANNNSSVYDQVPQEDEEGEHERTSLLADHQDNSHAVGRN